MDTARSIVHSVTHYIKNTDLYLMLLGLVCSIYGMLLIYSATLNPVTALDGSTKNLYVQGAAIILGLAAFVALSLIDLENLGDLWKIFVIGNILLQFLLFTPLGTEVNGQRAWLNLGVTSLQPGELGKLIFIFTIAAHMTEIQDHITEWRGLVSVGLHTLVMMGAVVLSSGDTGMAIQYLMIAVIMLFSAGLPLKWLGIAAGVGIASVPILWNYVLKDYQKTRILVLFDPSIDDPDISRPGDLRQDRHRLGAVYRSRLDQRHDDPDAVCAGEPDRLYFLGSRRGAGLYRLHAHHRPADGADPAPVLCGVPRVNDVFGAARGRCRACSCSRRL